jgi:hypothetical protein
MSTQEEGGEIRTSDLRFIRRGPNRLSYLLEKSVCFIEPSKDIIGSVFVSLYLVLLYKLAFIVGWIE